MRRGEESVAEYRYSSKTQCAICAVGGGFAQITAASMLFFRSAVRWRRGNSDSSTVHSVSIAMELMLDVVRKQ